jgi:hypothetical protein
MTTTDKDKSIELYKKLEQIKKGFVTIGIDEDSGSYEKTGIPIVKVALWNEFGTDTQPERSFLRTAIDEGTAQINKWQQEILINILEKNWSVEKGLKALGLRIQVLIQNKIKSNVPPPNKPSTLKRKHGSITLNDTKTMLRAVGYRVHL